MVPCPAALDLPHALVEWVTMLIVTREGDRRCKLPPHQRALSPQWVTETGTYDVMAGASSTNVRVRTTWRVKGETIPARDLSRTTRAENFDDYEGIRLVDESKARGTAVSASKDGAWLKFADAQLGGGADELSVRLAGESGPVEVRLGSPNGPLAGTAHFAGTSSPYTYETVTARLSDAAKGRTDVYLVLGGGQRLSTFSLR